MTSIETAKRELQEFLKSKEPQVLCITGKWGTGKTYAWREMVKSAAESKRLGLKKYSYVSLFGLGSLADLKTGVAENMQILSSELDSGTTAKVDASLNVLLKSMKVLKNFTSAIPYIGNQLSASQSLYFPLVVNDALVCIDDLDRHGPQLRIEDILGFATSLREDRGCKVAILLNEDRLEQSDKDILARHFEKVVDTRIVFAPTPEAAASIALEDEKSELAALVRDNCCRLRISNIRVIEKLMRLVTQIAPLIEGLSDEVKKQTVHSIVMFGWCRFEPDLAPTLEFLSTSSLGRRLEQDHRQKPSDKELAWAAIVDDYGFQYLDDYDKLLSNYVQAGIVDGDAIKLGAEKQNQVVGRAAALAAIEEGFRPFHDSFRDNPEEVAQSIRNALQNNQRFATFNHLHDAVFILKEIGRPDDAVALLAHFEANEHDGEFWNYEVDTFGRRPTDPDVIVAAERKLAATREPPFDPIAELAEASKSLDVEKLKRLAAMLTPKMLHEAILAREGIEERAIIHSGLSFAQFANASPDMLAIVECTKQALALLAKQSKLNAARVSKYGVTIDIPEIEN